MWQELCIQLVRVTKRRVWGCGYVRAYTRKIRGGAYGIDALIWVFQRKYGLFENSVKMQEPEWFPEL